MTKSRSIPRRVYRIGYKAGKRYANGGPQVLTGRLDRAASAHPPSFNKGWAEGIRRTRAASTSMAGIRRQEREVRVALRRMNAEPRGSRQTATGRNVGSFKTKQGSYVKGKGGRFIGSKG